MVKNTKKQSIEKYENLRDEFPDIWNAIVLKKIPKREINKFLLEFHLKILKEIEEGERSSFFVYSINDFWQIVVSSGYKLNPEVEDYILHLVDFDSENPNKKSPTIDYLDAPSEKTYYGNLMEIKKRAKELVSRF